MNRKLSELEADNAKLKKDIEFIKNERAKMMSELEEMKNKALFDSSAPIIDPEAGRREAKLK